MTQNTRVLGDWHESVMVRRKKEVSEDTEKLWI
jgi:hypothetical protein